jgi:LytS/YehU family sensor histidine kinase
MQIDPAALDAFVPHMILQPIVENAVRHGIAKRSGPGTVEIAAARSDGSLALSVRDDGPGLADEASLGKGLGLGNTRARLEVMYGASQSFVMRRPPEGGFEVAIRIPWNAAPEEIPLAIDGNQELVSASNG